MKRSALPQRCTVALAVVTAAFAERSAVAQSSDDLLPDVIIDADSLTETRLDTETSPGRRLLRLSTSTPNIGRGALEIRGTSLVGPDRQQVLQRIFRADGSSWDRLAGISEYHPSHGHTHFDGWAVYRLRSVLPDGSAGSVVAEGEKTSFCLMDLLPFSFDEAESAPPSYTSCGQTVQGISPGWADVYDLELDGQWIDVTELPDGLYWLEAEVDPEQQIVEALDGESNNLAQVRILLEAGAASPALPVPVPALSGTEPPAGTLPNPPPRIALVAPASDVTWVEQAYEGLPVQWSASDPELDPVSVALFFDRDEVVDTGTLPLGGYQDLAGYSGQAVINTAGLGIGTWHLLAVASDGTSSTGSWSAGSIVLYLKGDLDFDGHVDRADWVLLVQRRRELFDQPWPVIASGWEQLLDEDRDGDVDARDIDLFRSAALRFDSAHVEHRAR